MYRPLLVGSALHAAFCRSATTSMPKPTTQIAIPTTSSHPNAGWLVGARELTAQTAKPVRKHHAPWQQEAEAAAL